MASPTTKIAKMIRTAFTLTFHRSVTEVYCAGSAQACTASRSPKKIAKENAGSDRGRKPLEKASKEKCPPFSRIGQLGGRRSAIIRGRAAKERFPRHVKHAATQGCVSGYRKAEDLGVGVCAGWGEW